MLSRSRFAPGHSVQTIGKPRFLHFSSRFGYAVTSTFVYRTDGGIVLPNLGNFAGAATGGHSTRLYLPTGFNDVSHANTPMEYEFGTIIGHRCFSGVRTVAPQTSHTGRTLPSFNQHRNGGRAEGWPILRFKSALKIHEEKWFMSTITRLRERTACPTPVTGFPLSPRLPRTGALPSCLDVYWP